MSRHVCTRNPEEEKGVKQGEWVDGGWCRASGSRVNVCLQPKGVDPRLPLPEKHIQDTLRFFDISKMMPITSFHVALFHHSCCRVTLSVPRTNVSARNWKTPGYKRKHVNHEFLPHCSRVPFLLFFFLRANFKLNFIQQPGTFEYSLLSCQTIHPSPRESDIFRPVMQYRWE